MSDTNITTVFLRRCCSAATANSSVYQYDHGQILQIRGVELPETYTVDFCCAGDSETMPMIGNADGVSIPDDFLKSGKAINAFIWLSDETHGETRYEITINVRPRPARGDAEPTPEQQTVIDQLITKLDNDVAHVDEAVEYVEQHGGLSPFSVSDGENSAVLRNESDPNVVTGANSLAVGSGNNVGANNSAAFGFKNTIDPNSGGRNFVFGDYNEATLTSWMGFAAGGRNKLGATICNALGYGLIANCSFGTVLGGYNVAQELDDPDRTEYLVIVGNGANSRNRSNAATLDQKGNLWISGSLKIGNTTITEEQLIRLLALLN